MDDDKKSIVIGLGAGLGGFFGFFILVCICWHIFCGSWCDKKPSQPAIQELQRRNIQKKKIHPEPRSTQTSNTTDSVRGASKFVSEI
ncbi:unnamed protein product [Didymodactylos carnosus]|uniref:Uncharacterized protein n=1 Tax=Didymodactylos carnosus TaxID=1234261 RepID=A0A814WXQ4_9BILA|nr:unnamed protein product [Didymodactylos carnosus]CAF1211703.1 unnamed protein product [Didymodactylos carnosus]CAF3874330.1 unnamed protein product [Didymodactylos carnosus]CAF3975622.1 unnamed protein product [Didymodactylos carnosus]